MHFAIFTARVRSTPGRYCFHRCLSVYTWGRVTPSPSHNTSTGPMSFLGGTPVTGPRFLPGRYPSPRWGVPQSLVPGPFLGGTPVPDGVPQDGYTPPGMWYPLARSGWVGTPGWGIGQQVGVLATRRAVCLLRSRRRTALLPLFLLVNIWQCAIFVKAWFAFVMKYWCGCT